jgi:hypothetical protein
LYWKHTNEVITFELHVQNALFGLSDSTSYSDVIFAWLKNDGTGHFSDRKLINQNNHSIDSVQSWILIDALRKDDYTIFKFSRNIKLLCDENRFLNEDLDILSGATNRLIFSKGNQLNLFEETITIENLYNTDNFLLLNETKGPFQCPPKKQKPTIDSPSIDRYENQVDLMPGFYRLYWNYTQRDLIAEVHVKTLGWIGFGFSPNGGMPNSDVMIAWVTNDGKTNFTDRFINNAFQVVIDQKQDWKLLSAIERNGYTIVKFTRPINLCDADDRKIEVLLIQKDFNSRKIYK